MGGEKGCTGSETEGGLIPAEEANVSLANIGGGGDDI